MILDDEQWAHATSRGLLKRARKNLSNTDVSATTESFRLVSAHFDVTIIADPEGGLEAVAQARCSCPAINVCQHIVILGFWLRAAEQQNDSPAQPDFQCSESGQSDGQSDTNSRSKGDAANSDADARCSIIHEQLMAYPLASNADYGGRKNAMSAWRIFQELRVDTSAALSWRGDKFVVSIAGQPVRFVYGLGGLDGVLVTPAFSDSAIWRVVGVMVYQSICGADLSIPSLTGSGTTSASAADRALACLARVHDELAGVCSRGLLHCTQDQRQALEQLSIQAQAHRWFRLARLLRALAGHTHTLRLRSVDGNIYAAARTLAVAYAVATSLSEALREGKVPHTQVVGVAKEIYHRVKSLECTCVGVWPWSTPSGYRGVSALFWVNSLGGFVTWTDARLGSSQDFSPLKRLKQLGPWGSPDSLLGFVGQRCRVTGTAVSMSGRLSTSSTGGVFSGPAVGLADDLAHAAQGERAEHRPSESPGAACFEAGGPSTNDLSQLANFLTHDCGNVVTGNRRQGTACALVNITSRGLRFDEVQQALLWLLEDAQGNRVTASLRHSDLTAAALKRLERVCEALSPSDRLTLVGTIHQRAANVVFQPLSIVAGLREEVRKRLGLDDLWCIHSPIAAEGEAITREKVDRSSPALAPDDQQLRLDDVVIFDASHSRFLDQFCIFLTDLLAAGLPAQQFCQIDRELDGWVARLAAQGYPVLQRLAPASPLHRLLRLLVLVEQLREPKT